MTLNDIRNKYLQELQDECCRLVGLMSDKQIQNPTYKEIVASLEGIKGTVEKICKVREYPDDSGPYQTITIRNHWSYRDRIVIEIAGKEYTFIAEHLLLAIKNATNTQ